MIIVGSALVVSAAVGRSGIVELMMRPFTPHMKTTSSQVGILVSVVTVLSAFMKNIGALAIFMPIAFQISRRTGKPASRLLMPLSFGSLLGGLATLVGTSPNIIVSRMREDIVGEPFTMFDFAPVGIGLAVVGIVFLTFGWRLLPRAERAGAAGDTQFSIEDYTTEARLPPKSPLVGKTVFDLETHGRGGGDRRRHHPRAGPPLRPVRPLDPVRRRYPGAGGRGPGAGEDHDRTASWSWSA